MWRHLHVYQTNEKKQKCLKVMQVPQNGSPRLQLQDEVLRGSECVLKCVLIEASEAGG